MTQPMPALWLSIKGAAADVASGLILPTDYGRLAALRDLLTTHLEAALNPQPGPPPVADRPTEVRLGPGAPPSSPAPIGPPAGGPPPAGPPRPGRS